MEKKMKYDFELKLKFLKIFYLHEVIPPPSNFSLKMDIRGGTTPANTESKLISIKVCKFSQ